MGKRRKESVPPGKKDAEIQEHEELEQEVHQEINDEIQQDQEEQTLFPPNEVTHDPPRVEYRIHELIGTSSDGAIRVHRATYFVKNFSASENMNVQNGSVALKLSRADQESQDYKNLVQQVERKGLLPDHHPNIMEIENTFTDKGIYCVVFPYMGNGSLRSIMRSRFPDGLPHVFIIVALREALKGLCFLHDNDQVHREISAGQIFFSKVPQIKLSFSGSVYDHGPDQDDDDTDYLSVKSISKWASAPEVYNLQNDESYNPKADIWMIGIAALELAYGKVKIRSRGHFMSIVDKMKDEQRISPLREDEQSPSSKRHLFVAWMDRVTDKFKKRFDEFVYKCLAIDPADRPTARELLDSELFTTTKKGVIAFHHFLSESTS